MASQFTIGLVGNPNCGKTTLFNALTGAKQRVGNWPGVTVERKSGEYVLDAVRVEVVDLPGTYSLDVTDHEVSLDERVARDYVQTGEPDLIVNIVDAANLERNLYLTTQLIEMGVPLLVALNMTDVAAAKGVKVNAACLASELGCPVVSVIATTGVGIDGLKEAMVLAASLKVRPSTSAALASRVTELAATQDDDLDILIADARYGFASRIANAAITRTGETARDPTDRIDRVVLNRILGIPIFLLMMYLMFMFTINIGGAFIDFFDQAAAALAVNGLGELLGSLGAPEWLKVLLAKGVGGGLQTVATFIPVIGCLYLFLSVLEDSGYMARAAFVMDRFMRWVGLPGKSFVPLIVGFGCNVPAIMATRTLERRRDRLITIAMAPFMSCGARLPVYVLFAAAFFPQDAQNVVFGLYLIGIAVAVATGLVLKNSLLKGEATPFIMELPPYHLPTLKGVLIHTWDRLKSFVFTAGRIIVPMVLVLNFLNSVGYDGSKLTFGNEDSDKSVLAEVGRGIAPAFSPLGLNEENWPAAVGIFTGVLAKETVVGTLNATYQSLADSDAAARAEAGESAPFNLAAALSAAAATIPEKLGEALGHWADPLGIKVGDLADTAAVVAERKLASGTFGAMAARFDGPAGAFAYLLFILLYFPCTAAIAAVYQESGARWTLFVAAWTTGMAYGLSTITYQAATWAAHPATSTAWIGACLAALAIVFALLRWLGNRTAEAPIRVFPVPLRASSGATCSGNCCASGACNRK